MTGKLGFGLYGDYPHLADELAQSGATVCLVFDTALYLAQRIKAQNPNIVILGREYITDETLGRWRSAGIDTFRQKMHEWGDKLSAAYPDVDTWMSVNEWGGDQDLDRLADQVEGEKAFTDAVAARGKTSTVLSVSTGNFALPTDAQWARFASIVTPLFSYPGVGFVGLHEYGSNAYQLMNAPDAAWNALRHRAFLAGFDALGIRVPPLIISEYGEVTGWQPVGEAAAAADHIWFGQQIAQDARVFGATNFVHGYNGDPQWIPFDTANTSIYTQVVAWNRSQSSASSGGGTLPVAVVAGIGVAAAVGAFLVAQSMLGE